MGKKTDLKYINRIRKLNLSGMGVRGIERRLQSEFGDAEGVPARSTISDIISKHKHDWSVVRPWEPGWPEDSEEISYAFTLTKIYRDLLGTDYLTRDVLSWALKVRSVLPKLDFESCNFPELAGLHVRVVESYALHDKDDSTEVIDEYILHRAWLKGRSRDEYHNYLHKNGQEHPLSYTKFIKENPIFVLRQKLIYFSGFLESYSLEESNVPLGAYQPEYLFEYEKYMRFKESPTELENKTTHELFEQIDAVINDIEIQVIPKVKAAWPKEEGPSFVTPQEYWRFMNFKFPGEVFSETTYEDSFSEGWESKKIEEEFKQWSEE